MNTTRNLIPNYFKSFIVFLLILSLFQNCTIYRSNSISPTQAVKEEVKVKMFTKEGENVKFNRLASVNGRMLGLAKKNSKTSKLLRSEGVFAEEVGNLIGFGLDSLELNEIYPKNKSASTLGTIGIVLAAISTLFVALAVAATAAWT